jgi:hypothetical protein
MHRKHLITFIVALSSHIGLQAENPKDFTVESPTHNTRFTLSGAKGKPLVDLYRLWLDGSGRKERLTFSTNFRGWKAAEGVISDNGKFMLFQDGRGGMESGQGFSIYLYDFEQAQSGR